MSSTPTIASNPKIQALINGARRRMPAGNTVSFVITTRTGADGDLGIAGTAQETSTPIDPAPALQGVRIDAVLKSGGALRYSDIAMSVRKDDMTEDQVTNEELEFEVNGRRHVVVAWTPAGNTWEFVIRKK